MKELKDKERQAFMLRKEGKSLQEIAAAMGTTKEPVRMLIAKARRKLGLPLWEEDVSYPVLKGEDSECG